MEILLGITLFGAILGLSAIVYKELILPHKQQKEETPAGIKIKNIGTQTISSQPPEAIEPVIQEFSEPIPRQKQSKTSFVKGLVIGITLALVGFSLYTEQIKQSLKQIANKLSQKAKIQASTLQINNEKIVDGKKWLKFIYQSPSGKKHDGWICEASIHKSVPKSENLSTADKIYEKLGLQTSKERTRNLKSLKKLQKNLKLQMKILKEQ
jgi:hypothetical protein